MSVASPGRAVLDGVARDPSATSAIPAISATSAIIGDLGDLGDLCTYNLGTSHPVPQRRRSRRLRPVDACPTTTAAADEVGQRSVHVRYQDLDAHRPALGQVGGRLVLVVLDRGEQAGQVLDGVVGFEPCRLVGDETVAIGVGLVEGVVSEGLDDVEERRSRAVPRSPGPRTRPRTFRRSAAMRARSFLPQAFRRLSASSSEYPANR